MGLDLISKSSADGLFSFNQPHDNSMSITSGAIYSNPSVQVKVDADGFMRPRP